MRVRTVPAQTHRLEEYRDVFEGYRAIQLLDDSGNMRGELIWRLATGHTVEITEMGVFDEADRRQGWGTLLLEAALTSIHEFFAEKRYRLRKIYLFCDSINDVGRSFYERHGFRAAEVLPEFYHYCDAVLYVRHLEDGPGTN